MPQYSPSDQPLPQASLSELNGYGANDFGHLNHISDYDHNDYLTGLSNGHDLYSNPIDNLNFNGGGRYIEPHDQDHHELYPSNPTNNPALDSSLNGLRKSYNSAQDVETDVENVQMNLEAIMESLGMDPNTFDAHPTSPTQDIFGSSTDNSNRFDAIGDNVEELGQHPISEVNGHEGGEAPPMDIDSLLDHFKTSNENSFDSSQFEPPNQESIAERSNLMSNSGQPQHHHIDGRNNNGMGLMNENSMSKRRLSPSNNKIKISTSNKNGLTTPVPPPAPSTIPRSPPSPTISMIPGRVQRPKRKSDAMSPGTQGGGEALGLSVSRDDPPPTKKARTRRKKP